MNMKHDFPQMADGNVVYVRRVAMDSLPDEVRQDPAFHRTAGEEIGRDGCRVPLPWSAGAPHAGFGADREPWLKQIGQWLADRPEGAMVGCSALKRKYRDLIREYCPAVVFVHVHGDFDVLHERMQHRPGHFMPASLLQSDRKSVV